MDKIDNLRPVLDCSHYCNECHCTFLKNQDGYSNCSVVTRTTSLNDDESFFTEEIVSDTIYNFKTGEFKDVPQEK